MNFANIPGALKTLDQWLVWRLEDRGGKATKVPYNARTGRLGKSNDSDTWSSFADAKATYERGGYSGIGIAFREGDGLAGIDLDHVIDAETGEISANAEEVIKRFEHTYTEISPSGVGIRIFVLENPNGAARIAGGRNGRKFITIRHRAI